MPAEIREIIGRRWTYPGERLTNQTYRVYYKSGKSISYGANDTLPDKILRYILEADSAETTYYEGYTQGSTYTVAKTVYLKTTPEKTKPKRTVKRPTHFYAVLFYTQRNRVLINWQFITEAHNTVEAVEQARRKWNSEAHMFNCRASRIEETAADELEEFKALEKKPVTWGR